MKDFDIMDEAEKIATRYALRELKCMDFSDGNWATTDDEANRLLNKVRELVTSLEGAYRKTVTQGEKEQQLLLHDLIKRRPDFCSIEFELYNESERLEKEIDFIVMAKLWIREVEGSL